MRNGWMVNLMDRTSGMVRMTKQINGQMED